MVEKRDNNNKIKKNKIRNKIGKRKKLKKANSRTIRNEKGESGPGEKWKTNRNKPLHRKTDPPSAIGAAGAAAGGAAAGAAGIGAAGIGSSGSGTALYSSIVQLVPVIIAFLAK